MQLLAPLLGGTSLGDCSDGNDKVVIHTHTYNKHTDNINVSSTYKF